jgi:hypothetical protein
MAKRAIEPGQRYRDLQRGIFGRPMHSEWIVEAVGADGLGIPHARLAKVADLTERKTLSVCSLADRSRFEEIRGF